MDHEVEEVRGVIQNTITIEGSHFSGSNAENLIHFGGYDCVAEQSMDTMVVCKMDASQKPPMNTWLKVSMSVTGKGKAFASDRH